VRGTGGTWGIGRICCSCSGRTTGGDGEASGVPVEQTNCVRRPPAERHGATSPSHPARGTRAIAFDHQKPGLEGPRKTALSWQGRGARRAAWVFRRAAAAVLGCEGGGGGLRPGFCVTPPLSPRIVCSMNRQSSSWLIRGPFPALTARDVAAKWECGVCLTHRLRACALQDAGMEARWRLLEGRIFRVDALCAGTRPSLAGKRLF
jgi:hypothetical protein